MSDHDVIFREVDEELRRERMRSLWRRFGPYVIGAAVVVVLVVAVNEGWTWWRNNSAAHASDQFYAALKLSDGGDLAGAKAALDKIVAEGGGYGTLARFKQAAMLAKEGKPADAVAAYDALAGDEANVRLRELALVLAADILVDSGSLSDVESRVSSLVTTDNPMRNAAREAVGLAQYKAGDLEAARKTFEEQLQAQRDLVQANQDYYRLAERRYRIGIDSNLTFLDAQRNLFSAQQALIGDRLSQLTSEVNLYKALGGGWYEQTGQANNQQAAVEAPKS